MEKANKRIKVILHDISKAKKSALDDDDDLDDTEALQAELDELRKQNKAREDKLAEYEKNKKWNVDNMCKVSEERTMVNPSAEKTNFTPAGFVQPEGSKPAASSKKISTLSKAAKGSTPASHEGSKTTEKSEKPVASGPIPPPPSCSAPPATTVSAPVKVQSSHDYDSVAIESYPEFTEKYAETVEEFMTIPDLVGSKEFLLKYGDVLLQENASNYLLLASLEDEMNGYHEKMKRTARQSQIISHIAELARTMKTHPGNVIIPFFNRLEQRQHLEDFVAAVNDFCAKIVARAIVKKKEIDEAHDRELQSEGQNLEDIPREERLGPGGLDPVEVIKKLPQSMVKAFESRDVQQLRDALAALEPEDAERYMKDCVASGLWVANS